MSLNKHYLLVTGSVGSGKTELGKRLKQRIKRLAVFDMDAIKWQISDFQRGPADNKIVRAGVLALASAYCNHGLNILIPQCMAIEEIDAHKALAKENNYHLIHIELIANDEVSLKRIMKKPQVPGKPRTQERILENIAWYHKQPQYSDAIVIDTSNITADQVEQTVLDLLTSSGSQVQSN
ncbi:MAG: hypothetical protein HKM24_01690 [Gammaproteobacteria bacterium]|nr:hypothetical protein [Gammaproteobacteria bacterium]